MDDHETTNVHSQNTGLKRKGQGDENGVKISRSEGFSWWTSLILGVDSFASVSERKSHNSKIHPTTGNK